MSIRRRVYTRHNISLRVYVPMGGEWVEGATLDVSRGGMFVQIARSLEVGDKAQIRAEMLDGRMLKLGVTVRRVVRNPAPGQPGPGLALELTDTTVIAQARWEDFVLQVGGEAQANIAPDDGAASDAPRSGPSQAKTGSAVPHIVARPRNKDELHAVQSNVLRHGRLHVRSAAPCGPGDEVVIVVVHPESDGELGLPGLVDRVVGDESGRRVGLRVMVGELTVHLRRELAAFVDQGRVPTTAESAEDPLAALRKAFLDDPGDAQAAGQLAWGLLLQRGDVSAANGAFRRALELNAADVESCWGMALTQALLGDGDGEGALRLAARAHERATQYP